MTIKTIRSYILLTIAITATQNFASTDAAPDPRTIATIVAGVLSFAGGVYTLVARNILRTPVGILFIAAGSFIIAKPNFFLRLVKDTFESKKKEVSLKNWVKKIRTRLPETPKIEEKK